MRAFLGGITLTDYRASRAIVVAFDTISDRLGKIRFELETVRDIETASSLVRDLQKKTEGLTDRIVILDDRPEKSLASVRRAALARMPRDERGSIRSIATYLALFATGAAVAMALQLGDALADLVVK